MPSRERRFIWFQRRVYSQSGTEPLSYVLRYWLVKVKVKDEGKFKNMRLLIHNDHWAFDFQPKRILAWKQYLVGVFEWCHWFQCDFWRAQRNRGPRQIYTCYQVRIEQRAPHLDYEKTIRFKSEIFFYFLVNFSPNSFSSLNQII